MSWFPQMVLRETKDHFCAVRDWNHKEWYCSSSLFYNSDIECQHFREKLEQSYKKGSLETVISTLEKLVERQENEEIKVIYWSSPYSLSKQYSKFKIDSVKWHSMGGDYRRRQIKKFRMYKPTLDVEYVKPKKSGKKPSDGVSGSASTRKQKWL